MGGGGGAPGIQQPVRPWHRLIERMTVSGMGSINASAEHPALPSKGVRGVRATKGGIPYSPECCPSHKYTMSAASLPPVVGSPCGAAGLQPTATRCCGGPCHSHKTCIHASFRVAVKSRVFLSACPTQRGGVSEFLGGWVSNRPPPPRVGDCGGLWVSAEGAGQGIVRVVRHFAYGSWVDGWVGVQ